VCLITNSQEILITFYGHGQSAIDRANKNVFIRAFNISGQNAVSNCSLRDNAVPAGVAGEVETVLTEIIGASRLPVPESFLKSLNSKIEASECTFCGCVDIIDGQC